MSTSESGIYIITNTRNQKCYIGSTVHFQKRWYEHHRILHHGNHHNLHLQHAWNKYGESAFKFGILEYVSDLKRLYLAEQFWMDIYREEGRDLYNNGLVAHNARRGCTVSEETRYKMSEVKRGENNPMYGRPVSIETRARLSNALRGHKHTKEARQKMSIAQSGNQKSAKTYPAFTHKETGEIIPPGFNLSNTCRKHTLNRNRMWDIVHGRRKSYHGWSLYNGENI